MSSSAVAFEDPGPEHELEFEEEAPRGGVTTARLGALVPLALGVFGLVVSLGLGIGSPSAPGAGLWPFVISLCMIAAAGTALLRAKQDDDVEAFDRGILTVGLSVVSLLVYAGLLPLIGFEIPTVLLLFFWIKVLGKEGWRSAIVVSLVATVAVYGLFVLLLAVPIPHLF
ncbi:tripartite tricarboxylate transporter TctB family protein [Kocuria sediminis]|uniref:tripartite tricarboxylate transporter TctB family protein n=1 Tax=Kocuria sediminis TaxID=1038857 RepID=UPI0012E2FEC9